MTKNKYEEPAIQESQEIKIILYKKFEDKFSEECKTLPREEFEHKRNEYIEKNFYQEYINFKNKK